jgi:hypothetical protein
MKTEEVTQERSRSTHKDAIPCGNPSKRDNIQFRRTSMKKAAFALLFVVVSISYFGFAAGASTGEIKKGDFVTVCNSGQGCGKFEVASMDPKGCKCGAQSEKLHVLKVEGEVAVLCQCGGMCACELNAKNPYLCGCGSPVKVVRILK